MKIKVELDLNKTKSKKSCIPVNDHTLNLALKFCFLQLGLIILIVLIGLLVCYLY